MCIHCDGYSHEQSLLALDLTIRTHGWALTQVTDTNPWSYTVGLLESYDHPELMITGLELDMQSPVLRRLVDAIEKTGSVDHALLERETSPSSRCTPTISPATGSAPGRTSTNACRRRGASCRSCRRRTGSATATITRCPTSSFPTRSASATEPTVAAGNVDDVRSRICRTYD